MLLVWDPVANRDVGWWTVPAGSGSSSLQHLGFQLRDAKMGQQENSCNDQEKKEDFKNQQCVLNSRGDIRSQEAQQLESKINSVIDSVLDTAKRSEMGSASSSDDEDDVLISEITRHQLNSDNFHRI